MTIRPLTPELAEKARIELNEDPKRVTADIQHIKDWIAKQPHLRSRTDDQWILTFLRGCKFSLERTKEKLDLFYSFRTTAPDFFRITVNHPKFFEILDFGTIVLLPKAASPDSPLVMIIRPATYNPDKFNIVDIMSVSNTIQKIILWENDQAIIAGIRNIIDLDNVSMSHFLQMTPMVIKKMVVSGQDAAPLRMKGAHYLNTPVGFETVFNAFKALLNEKNKNRLYVHNKNYEEMYKYISKDILPKEYGGNGGSFKEINDYWKKKVQDYSSWLEEDEKYGTDESKRPGKPKTAEDMFGLEGSFRQLQVD